MISSGVFFLSDMAAILGIPETRVKNWTIGRPIRITPHRRARGTGFRNLYDMHDLCRFAIAKQLSMDGFAARAIRLILDSVTHPLTSQFAIVSSKPGHEQRSRRGAELYVRVISQSEVEQEGWHAIEGLVRRSFGAYVLNIAAIAEDVNHRAEKLLHKDVVNREAIYERQQPDFTESAAQPEFKRKFREVK